MVLFVITLRFVNTTVFSIEMTLNALLMTMIGGVGTLIGAIAGAGIIESLKILFIRTSDGISDF